MIVLLSRRLWLEHVSGDFFLERLQDVLHRCIAVDFSLPDEVSFALLQFVPGSHDLLRF